MPAAASRPDPEREPAPCPYCGDRFTDPTAFRLHLADAHRAPGAIPTTNRSDALRMARASARIRRTWHGLRFLPIWFVLPANLALVAVVWMSFSSPWHPLFAVAVRTAMLPSILLLAARVAGQKPML